MTPLGIGLGTVASGFFEGQAALLIEGSFNALAAGTFIYIAIMDIINAEMSRIDDRIAHYVRSSLLGDDDVAMRVTRYGSYFQVRADRWPGQYGRIGVWV